MQDIIDTDGEHTPIDERTIDYFVDGYIDRYAHDTTHRLHLVHIHKVQSEAVHPADAPAALTPIQVEGIFAGQSEWILTEQISEPAQKRIISVSNWQAFCQRVRRRRREARRRGVEWGLPYGDVVEDDFEDNINLSRYRIIGKTNAQAQLRAASKKKRQPVNSPFLFAQALVPPSYRPGPSTMRLFQTIRLTKWTSTRKLNPLTTLISPYPPPHQHRTPNPLLRTSIQI